MKVNMNTQIRTGLNELLKNSIRKAIEYNQPDAIDSVYNNLLRILIEYINKNNYQDFNSKIFLIHQFIWSAESSEKFKRQLLQRNLRLFYDLFIVLFNRTTIDYFKFHNYLNNSIVLMIKKLIEQKDYKNFESSINLLNDLYYLFKPLDIEYDFFNKIKKINISYTTLDSIALISWSWHLYRFNKIDYAFCEKISQKINTARIEYRTLLEVLASISSVNQDILMNWMQLDNLDTTVSSHEWIEFGITILLLKSNLFNHKIKEEEKFILNLYKDVLIEYCNEITKDFEKWSLVLNDDIKKCDRLLKLLNEEK